MFISQPQMDKSCSSFFKIAAMHPTIVIVMFCREELLEQTQVSRRYETRAKDLKTLLDNSNDKLQVSVGLN